MQDKKRKPCVKSSEACVEQDSNSQPIDTVGKTGELVSTDATGGKEYHILSLSGGKDSTALALHIKENMPEIHEKIEYVFIDTECELSETYDYLNMSYPRIIVPV